MSGPEVGATVDIEGVRFAYCKRRRRIEILSDAHATFSEGSRTVVVGRSGEGKSTILDLIAGIRVPEEGEVRVLGDRMYAMGANY